MSAATDSISSGVQVRYWAAARAAAGVESGFFNTAGPVSVAELLERATERRGPALARVVSVCSVLIGEDPLGTRAPDSVLVRPGDYIELLPPFAGG